MNFDPSGLRNTGEFLSFLPPPSETIVVPFVVYLQMKRESKRLVCVWAVLSVASPSVTLAMMVVHAFERTPSGVTAAGIGCVPDGSQCAVSSFVFLLLGNVSRDNMMGMEQDWHKNMMMTFHPPQPIPGTVGGLVLLCRVLLWIWGFRCFSNFGAGLKEKGAYY